MKSKKAFNLLLCASFCASTLFSQSEYYGDIDYSKAINMAGKQRMLSQKLAKSYLLLTKGINGNEITKELNSSKFIFEKQLQILKENAEAPNLKTSITEIEEIWNQFKNIIVKPTNIDNSKEIIALNSSLLKRCDNLVTKIEGNSKNYNQSSNNNNHQLVEIINIAGKQRMLSQRICLYYTALKLFPDKKSEYQAVLTESFEEFDAVIEKLLLNKNTNLQSQEELQVAQALWEPFKPNKKDILEGNYPLEEIFKTTNDLTATFNKITGIYEIVANNY